MIFIARFREAYTLNIKFFRVMKIASKSTLSLRCTEYSELIYFFENTDNFYSIHPVFDLYFQEH